MPVGESRDPDPVGERFMSCVLGAVVTGNFQRKGISITPPSGRSGGEAEWRRGEPSEWRRGGGNGLVPGAAMRSWPSQGGEGVIPVVGGSRQPGYGAEKQAEKVEGWF